MPSHIQKRKKERKKKEKRRKKKKEKKRRQQLLSELVKAFAVEDGYRNFYIGRTISFYFIRGDPCTADVAA